jgi:N-acetylglucosamine malate deacetylase 1
VSEEFEQWDVVAVGAHPDDVEIGCGGTLASLAKNGYRVGIIDLTDGEPTPLSPGPEVRLQEAQKAAEALGVQRTVLQLPNRRLFDGFDERVALAKEFRKRKPKLVLGIGDRTPTASPDHWQAMQITDAAVFYSRLTKWDEHFEGLPVHRVTAQAYYQLAFDVPTLFDHKHNVVVDISDTYQTKIQAIRCYQTQFPPAKDFLFKRIETLAHACGVMAGFNAGEIIQLIRPVGTQDLFKLILADSAEAYAQK